MSCCFPSRPDDDAICVCGLLFEQHAEHPHLTRDCSYFRANGHFARVPETPEGYDPVLSYRSAE